MDYRKFDDKYYIRLDRGEEIIAALTQFCATQGVTAASVQGIGGCGRAVVGVFDPVEKSYHRQEVNTLLELISLDGNVTLPAGEPFLHLHASFAYHDESGAARVLAGHLLEATVALTGEIILIPAAGVISRRYDEALGIRVWDFN